MRLPQFLSELTISIQGFFMNELLPWMITYGATAITIWLIGFLFSLAVWFFLYKKAIEEIDKEKKELAILFARLPNTTTIPVSTFTRFTVWITPLYTWAIAILLLIPFWPLLLGLITAPKLLRKFEEKKTN